MRIASLTVAPYLVPMLCAFSIGNCAAAPYVATLLLPSGGFTEGQAVGINNGVQVGSGHGSGTVINPHALLWSGTAASAVDINPSGFRSSAALGIAGNNQVGVGSRTGAQRHALLWHGSAASAIDLNPAGFTESHGWATSATQQVGYGLPNGTSTDYHALLWSGSAASAVDLTPTGFDQL